MVTIAAILIVLIAPIALLVAAAAAIDAWRRARAEVIARQIQLTDAIHAELGPVVSPFVRKRVFQPWRVTFAVPEPRVREMARLVTISDRVLNVDGLNIVFIRPTAA